LVTHTGVEEEIFMENVYFNPRFCRINFSVMPERTNNFTYSAGRTTIGNYGYNFLHGYPPDGIYFLELLTIEKGKSNG
jgi:hypothetical protein